MGDMDKAVLLIGSLDTKGAEYAYARDLIAARGFKTLTMDVGVLGDPPFAPDIPASETARAGGGELDALRAAGDRGAAVEIMGFGARALCAQLDGEGRIAGVLALGGGGGTSIAATAMAVLPVGVPKVMVSTMAAGDTAPYVGVKDVTMMYPVVDIAGLNRLSRRIIANAVGAVCGMAEQEPPPETGGERPLVAATMFGVTTPCVDAVRERLDAAGCETLVFHATGSGGRAMEALIAGGYVTAVADITTTEWCDEVVGGVLSAGPTRLEAAARAGVPQVVSVGALDMVNFGPADTVPEPFRGRTLYKHNPSVTLMRTTPEECREIARRIVEKLNAAKGPTALLLPLRGVSMISAPGQPFHDPDADAALFDTFRSLAGPNVEIVEVDAHINDAEFAAAAADRLLALIAAGRSARST